MKLSLHPDIATYRRLYEIERSVRDARDRFFRKNPAHGGKCFSAPCVPDNLHPVIQRINLPRRYSFADLGSNFGAAGFTAALSFERVVGFGKEPDFVACANELKGPLGIGNVDFVVQDFRRADLSEFNVLHVCQPFTEEFVPEMKRVLEGVNCGTVVISDIFEEMRAPLFPGSSYKLLYPGAYQSLPTNIFVYRKISG